MQAKSSTVSEGSFLLILTLIGVGILYYSLDNHVSAGVMLTFIILVLALLMPAALTRFRIYKLDHTGILCTWFGFHYRFISWNKIIDVSRVYLKYGATVLLITTKDGAIIRPTMGSGGMCPSSKEFERSMSKGNHFFLQDTPSVIGCIHQYYGQLNYDCKK